MKKIMVVIGTRPEAIKMAPVIRQLRQQAATAKVIVCSTGQHREMLQEAFATLEIEPDIDLCQMKPGQNVTDLLGRLISALAPVLETHQPDIVVAQGDTTTVLAATLAGFLARRTTAHVEAGLRTADRYSPFPEEMHRRVVGVVADIHFPPTSRAAMALQSEGVSEDRIFITGNTGIDSLQWMAGRVAHQPLPPKLARIVQDRDRLVLITAHRRENFGQPLRNLCEAIRTLAHRHTDTAFVYTVHMNPNVQGPVKEILGDVDGVHLIPPLSYSDMVAMLLRCRFVLTDSGGLQEEAPSLGKPVLVMRENTERPEAVSAGVARMVGTNPERIIQEASLLLDDDSVYEEMARPIGLYGDGRAAERIAQVLLTGSMQGVPKFRPGIALPLVSSERR